MSHTKEPLQLAGGGLIYRLSAPEGGHNVDEINVTMWGGSRSPESRSEGAKRVRACMDACKRINIETLEGVAACGGISSEPIEQIVSITKQRDELLAAVKRFTLYPGCTCDRDYEIANAAIASVKGGADCAETDECAIPLYEKATIDSDAIRWRSICIKHGCALVRLATGSAAYNSATKQKILDAWADMVAAEIEGFDSDKYFKEVDERIKEFESKGGEV